MTSYAIDANILIDALLGHPPARQELQRILISGGQIWISRIAWIEILSKGNDAVVRETLQFLRRFNIDESDDEIAQRAASLRRARSSLKTPDAIILATAQTRGRVLVTRNTKDFPANMPGIRVPYQL